MRLKSKFSQITYIWAKTFVIFSLYPLDWTLPNWPINPTLCQNVMFFHQTIVKFHVNLITVKNQVIKTFLTLCE
jgi:hypothetical protein